MTNDPQALAAAVLEEAWKAAFRACKSTEAGYFDENSRLAQRIENELRLEVVRAIRALITPAMSEALDRAIAEAVARVRFDEREQAVRVAYGVLKNDCYCLTASNMEALASDLIIAIRKGESHD